MLVSLEGILEVEAETVSDAIDIVDSYDGCSDFIDTLSIDLPAGKYTGFNLILDEHDENMIYEMETL